MRRQARVSRLRQVTDTVALTGRQVLVAVGYDDLTVERVAAEAGLEVEVVRHYVADRDALVALVLERWQAEDPDDRLLHVIRDELPPHLHQA